MTVTDPAVEEAETLEALRTDTEFWCEAVGKIRSKEKKIVPFVLNAGQRALDGMLRAQREAGLPQRAVALKARQVGVSTYAQAKLVQGGTLTPNFEGVCLAHDLKGSTKLWQIGDRLYRNLPNEPKLKPPIRHHARARFMHWGLERADGTITPDSSYHVDTAGESEAGRGGTLTAVHASEFAFWPNPTEKLVALQSVVPEEDPDAFFIIESTANGHNMFRDLWQDAFEGRSAYAPFFWPWWKDEGYTRAFLNEAEREAFKVGDGPYGEDEPPLVNPGPIDTMTGEHHPLTLEQLYWRRWAIANRAGGKLDKFKQEYPATPEEAFLATGRKVFDPIQVSMLLAETEKTDPRVPSDDGPLLGALASKDTEPMVGRTGPIDVPRNPFWKPKQTLGVLEQADWKLWLDEENGMPVVPKDSGYVIGVDVSEGISESDPEGGEPAYHAIEVIDHKSGDQVAEYVSRTDPALLAIEVYLAARFFNDAWLAVEKTGYGLHILRQIHHDFNYPSAFIYFRKPHDTRSDEKISDRLGWDTNRQSKPLLIANGEELLREQTTGIRSRELVLEMQSYVRAAKTAKTLPERGRFADRLMAWLIAKQVALEKPLRIPTKLPPVVHAMKNAGY